VINTKKIKNYDDQENSTFFFHSYYIITSDCNNKKKKVSNEAIEKPHLQVMGIDDLND